jgi:hypothetical protein
MARANDEAYELQLRSLVGRLESASDHYRRLGLANSSSGDEIREAYLRAMRLHPRSWVAGRIPEELRKRAERAFGRLLEAFAVLSDGRRRADYDRLLRAQTAHPMAAAGGGGVAKSVVLGPTASQTGGATGASVVGIDERSPRGGAQRVVPANRRETERLTLRIPTRVTGFTAARERWTESVRTADVSATGAALVVSRRVVVGQVLYLQLPLPDGLRTRATADRLYEVFAVVRHVDPPSHGDRCVGVQFIGTEPPQGFLANPSGFFEIERRVGGDLRAEPRYEILLTFAVRFLGDVGEAVGETVGYSENVSRRGARIRLATSVADVDLLELSTPDRSFVTEAVVRTVYRGDDGHDRACIQFLDAFFPVAAYGWPD